MNPGVLNQSPYLEYRAPSHAKRILSLNKRRPKETETEERSTGPRPLVNNVRYPQSELGWAGLWVRPRPVPRAALSAWLGQRPGIWRGTRVLTQAAGSVRLASRCPSLGTGLGAWFSQLKSSKARRGLIPQVGGGGPGGGGGQSGPSSSAHPGFQARFQRHHRP